MRQLFFFQQLALAHSLPGNGTEFTEAPTFRLAKAKAKAATRVLSGERVVYQGA